MDRFGDIALGGEEITTHSRKRGRHRQVVICDQLQRIVGGSDDLFQERKRFSAVGVFPKRRRDLVLVNSYLLQICLPLNALGFIFREGRDALASTEKLFALLERKPEIEDRPDAAALSVARGEVVFERVDFSYEPGHQILV